MRIRAVGLGLFGGLLALAAISPASAEFFNCHQKPGQLLYSYSGSPGQYSGRSSSSSSRYGSSYAAQPARPRYQSQATYSGSRHSWNDRSRW